MRSISNTLFVWTYICHHFKYMDFHKLCMWLQHYMHALCKNWWHILHLQRNAHTFWRNSSAIYQFYNNIFKFKIQLFWGCNNIDSFLIRRFKKETFLFCSRLSADAAYGIDQDIDQRVYSAPVFPRSNWSLYESILFSEAFLFVLLSWYFHFILYYILLQLVTCQGPAATKRDDHLESSTTNIKDYNFKL